MAASTPRGISYPTSEDKIKDGSSLSALADDFMGLATSADAAIAASAQEAKDAAALDATAKADAAEQGAIDDATAKYGGLPQRVTDAESKNTEQDGRLTSIDSDLAEIFATTQAIDAPTGFDANSVTGQAVHMVNGLDEALNMPGAGSWTLLTYPNTADGAALQQLAVRYSVSDPELWSRVKTSGGWSAWSRLDADKWVERLDGLDSIQAIKSVRFENGQWVWDLARATHYVLIAHDGKPTVRATQWPQPSPTTPEFTW